MNGFLPCAIIIPLLYKCIIFIFFFQKYSFDVDYIEHIRTWQSWGWPMKSTFLTRYCHKISMVEAHNSLAFHNTEVQVIRSVNNVAQCLIS